MSSTAATAGKDSLAGIESLGRLIENCTIPGETRADGAYPCMGGALQVSRNRWLLCYSTRGFLGIDDGFNGSDNDRSIVVQLRKDSPIGPVIRERMLAQYIENWDPRGRGERVLKQHCHTGAFGVPKGALIEGKRVPHENLFVLSWYCTPRGRGTGPTDLTTPQFEDEIHQAAFCTQWVQVRLNEAEDDIEIVQPVQKMRQVGFEEGEKYCDLPVQATMNSWYVPSAPLNGDMSEWVRVPHFSRGIAAIRMKFNGQRGVYEWVQTGALRQTSFYNGIGHVVPQDGSQLTETSIVRDGERWAIVARTAELHSKVVRGPAWFVTDDPFKPLPDPVYPGTPLAKSPCGVFRGADGGLRLFTNDPVGSPYKNDRDPLYCWDVDLDGGVKVTNPRVVFDATAAGFKVRPESQTRVDMPNLLPHAGGTDQIVTCRVRVRFRGKPPTRLLDEEKRLTGFYHARLVYREACPATWKFA